MVIEQPSGTGVAARLLVGDSGEHHGAGSAKRRRASSAKATAIDAVTHNMSIARTPHPSVDQLAAERVVSPVVGGAGTTSV
ncbi:MAG: hypothetical protein R2697_05595 [Ilumatobacteraceae bacterium]